MDLVYKMNLILIRLVFYALNLSVLPLAFICCILSRFCKRTIDVGMGPVPLINNVYFAKALRLKGYKVETFVNATYFITREFDYNYSEGWKKVFRYLPTFFFIRSIFRYKCLYVYFNGGPLQTLKGLWYLEPFLYKLAGVKLVVMPYGSDSQIFEYTPNKMMLHTLSQDYPNAVRKNHSRVMSQVKLWSRYADIVIGAMDSIDYLYYWNRLIHCHYAIDVDNIQPVYHTGNSKIKIFHAPNHTNIKGTKFIKKAIDELVKEGYAIEFIMEQGKSNSEIIQIIKSADIIIDQLIIGWYAMFSLEAMAAGKPTICYLREDLRQFFEMAECIEKDEIPLISAHTMNIKEVLKKLIDNREDIPYIGKKSRKYVEKYHSLHAIGNFFDGINKDLFKV